MISALVDLLAVFSQAGDLAQVEVITRSMLSAIPEDLVALQFLGLALYQTGRIEEARGVFARVPASLAQYEKWDGLSVCEPAGVATFRAATQACSGLAEGWNRIGLLLKQLGFHRQAVRAFEAASSASGPGRRLSAERRRLNES